MSRLALRDHYMAQSTYICQKITVFVVTSFHLPPPPFSGITAYLESLSGKRFFSPMIIIKC